MRVPPTNGNGKYVLLLPLRGRNRGLLAIARVVRESRRPLRVAMPSVSAVPSDTLKVDDLPPPPDIPDANSLRRRKHDRGEPVRRQTCSGSYDERARDGARLSREASAPLLRQRARERQHAQGESGAAGLRVASNGNVCEVDVTSNDMGTSSVASCVSNWFRSAGHFPAPRGGCIDAKVPISFVPGGR